MTHDELVTKLNTAYIMRDVRDIYNLHRALRAVVELHEPKKFHGMDEYYCLGCGADHYPCVTIDAIEKELNWPKTGEPAPTALD